MLAMYLIHVLKYLEFLNLFPLRSLDVIVSVVNLVVVLESIERSSDVRCYSFVPVVHLFLFTSCACKSASCNVSSLDHGCNFVSGDRVACSSRIIDV